MGFLGKSKRKQNLLVLLIFIIGVAIFYGNTLQNGYIHDDHGQIEQNIYVHSLKYLPKVITGCIWESADGSCKGTYYYRPLQNLSYMFTYLISPNPWIFHLVNLIYFAIGVFLTFIMIRLLTKNFLIAFFAALIFLIHPLNTETVNWAATVPELLYTIFILLSTIFYFLYRTKPKTKYLVFVCIFYGLGIFSKEPAVFLPFVFLTMDLTYFKEKISSLFNWKILRTYVICVVTFAVYMILRFRALGGLGADPTYKLTILQRVYIFLTLFTQYIQKLFWPHPLNLFYTFHPVYQFFSPHFLIAFLVVTLYIVLGVVAWKRRWFLVLFSLVWFFVFLFPDLVFVNSIGENLFAERHVFASTIGFTILLAILLEQLWRRKTGKIVASVFLAVVIVLSFNIVFHRNMLWRNDVLIYADTLKNSPDADLIRYNLAFEYGTEKKFDLAKKYYEEIIKRNSWNGLYKAYNNLGDLYREKGNYNQAVKYYQKSIQINPLHKESYNNLGAQYAQRGYLLQSLPYLCKALLIDPNFKDANTNFNYVSSQIQGLDNKSFTLLHNQMLEGTIFKPSPNKDTITLQNKDCSYQQGCILTFNANLKPNEFLFPFLIYANTPNNQVVRIRYSAFNQGKQGYQIALGIDHSFGNTPIHFYIPSCSGIYYEVNTEGGN